MYHVLGWWVWLVPCFTMEFNQIPQFSSSPECHPEVFFIISKFRYSLQFHKDVLYTKAKIKGGVVHIQPWYPCRVTAQHCFKFRLVKLLQVLGKILENNLNTICAKVYAHKTCLCCAGKIWINFSCGLLKKVS